MSTHFYVTKTIKKWWDKEKLGPIFEKKLSDFLAQKATTPEPLFGTEVYLSKFNGISSRPTFVWFERHDDTNSVYVLRTACVHNDYVKTFDASQKETWSTKFALDEEEEKEVSDYLTTIAK